MTSGSVPPESFRPILDVIGSVGSAGALGATPLAAGIGPGPGIRPRLVASPSVNVRKLSPNDTGASPIDLAGTLIAVGFMDLSVPKLSMVIDIGFAVVFKIS